LERGEGCPGAETALLRPGAPFAWPGRTPVERGHVDGRTGRARRGLGRRRVRPRAGTHRCGRAASERGGRQGLRTVASRKGDRREGVPAAGRVPTARGLGAKRPASPWRWPAALRSPEGHDPPARHRRRFKARVYFLASRAWPVMALVVGPLAAGLNSPKLHLEATVREYSRERD